MNNEDERDYLEEQYNAQLLREDDSEYHLWGPSKTTKHTPVCTECRAVRIYGDSGHRGDFHEAVALCPLHAAAPGMVEVLGRIVRAFDPPMDLVNAHKVVESNWFRKNMDDARALLAQLDGEGSGQ